MVSEIVMPKINRFILGIIGILIVLWFSLPEGINAQSSQEIYWRYDAPGRLSHVEVADLDKDGIDEFIVVADEARVMLLGSDGVPRWNSPFLADDPISVVTTADLIQDATGSKAIIIGTLNELIVIDENGDIYWRRDLRNSPVFLHPLPINNGAKEELFIGLSDGQLLRFNGVGQLSWQFEFTDRPATQAQPNLAIDDIDRDGRPDVVFTYLASGNFSKVVLIDASGQTRWERSNNGSINALEIVDFDSTADKDIAIATSANTIVLYTSEGDRKWPYRTINVPISNLSAVQLGGIKALLATTHVGTAAAYNEQGRRLWSRSFDPEASRSISNISHAAINSGADNPVALAITLEQPEGNGEPSDVILLDSSGRRLEPSYPTSDYAGLSRLVDINSDNVSELLLAGFATLELLDPGVGARQYYATWDYRLGAKPQSVIVLDLDLDGEQEIVIGASDGRLHALASNGETLWTRELGGSINHLVAAKSRSEVQPLIFVVHNHIPSEGNQEGIQSWVETLLANGQTLWSAQHAAIISNITVADINNSPPSELLIGTNDGQLIAYSLAGDVFWKADINAGTDFLSVVEGARSPEIIVGTSARAIDRLNNKGTGLTRLFEFLYGIVSVDQLILDERLIPLLVVSVEDGTVHGLGSRGSRQWEVSTEGTPLATLPADNTLIVATDDQVLTRINNQGEILWRMPEVGRVTALYWGDLDGDNQPDLAAGNRAGEVRLINGDGRAIWGVLELASDVFNISALRQEPSAPTDLVTITDNGIVQVFSTQTNRPPLLTKPVAEASRGRYNISVSVIDVEKDAIAVTLEIYNPDLSQWTSYGENIASSGNDILFWPVDPPAPDEPIQYRFQYNDGTHSGTVRPGAGPPPIPETSLFARFSIVITAGILILVGVSLYYVNFRLATTAVRRYSRQIRQRSHHTLVVVEKAYSRHDGSPDFLLVLARFSRKDGNYFLAELADGLFLMPTRPESALPIILSALKKQAESEEPWLNIDEWIDLFEIGATLVTVPGVTEIGLLSMTIVAYRAKDGKSRWRTEFIDSLIPITESLQGSERLDLVEDRLIYLQEAIGLLRQIQHATAEWPTRIEARLAQAITGRWIGLIRADIEELHGKAQIRPTLLTKRLVPGERTIVALELLNAGRSAAEQINVTLHDEQNYEVLDPTKTLPYLSPGRSRQVQFALSPVSGDQFRVVFEISYDDRTGQGKSMAFADQVNLLPPRRAFSPIENPYSPGMPLRKNSVVFYGRGDLFDFIAEATGNKNQPNVLVLVGQRRMGKTSALLQLERHLPETFFPVYIDCQSLGVIPGMPALFQDLAWIISDATSAKGVDLISPDSIDWTSDSVGQFRRIFIPELRSKLPPGTIILLIFDEFEAFQNLVEDGLLPATLFTYLRHLMQHGQGLNFIFAGTRRLEEMGSDYWSVLFNAALYRRIDFLNREESIRLIRDPVSPHLIYDDLAIDKIWRVTSGHPYFLQLVCYSLVNNANRQKSAYVTISDVNTALEDMMRLGEVHFAYLWHQSTYAEKAILAAAARIAEIDPTFRPSDLSTFLNEYSVYLDPADVTLALNRLVEREIISEVATEIVPVYELKIGLVGLWIAQNKSLVGLYETSREPGRASRAI